MIKNITLQIFILLLFGSCQSQIDYKNKIDIKLDSIPITKKHLKFDEVFDYVTCTNYVQFIDSNVLYYSINDSELVFFNIDNDTRYKIKIKEEDRKKLTNSTVIGIYKIKDQIYLFNDLSELYKIDSKGIIFLYNFKENKDLIQWKIKPDVTYGFNRQVCFVNDSVVIMRTLPYFELLKKVPKVLPRYYSFNLKSYKVEVLRL